MLRIVDRTAFVLSLVLFLFSTPSSPSAQLTADSTRDSVISDQQPGLRADFFGFKVERSSAPPSGPGAFALGTFVDTRQPHFRLAAFMDVPALAPFNETDTAGIAWRGLLRAEQAGDYVIVAELDIGVRWGIRSCLFDLQLGGDRAIRLEPDPSSGSHLTGRHTASTVVALTADDHEIGAWLSCATNTSWRPEATEAVVVRLLWRSPGGAIVQPIPADAFRHEIDEP